MTKKNNTDYAQAMNN